MKSALLSITSLLTIIGFGYSQSLDTTLVKNLKKGWNLVGYVGQTPETTLEAFAPIMDNVVSIKTLDGFYNTEVQTYLNSLTTIVPLDGVLIKVKDDCTLERTIKKSAILYYDNEEDPLFSNSPAGDITVTDIENIQKLSGTNTGDQDLTEYAKITNIPTVVTELDNDAGYITDYTEKQTIADVTALGNEVNGQLKNLETPTDAMDAVTKAYVDRLETILFKVTDPQLLIDAGVSSNEFVSAGVSLADLLEKEIGFETIISNGATLEDFASEGLTLEELLNEDIPFNSIISAGATLQDFYDDGVSLQDLVDKQIPIESLQDVGVPNEDLLDVGAVVPNGVTDLDGNNYKIVKIGDQVWMAENLKVTSAQSGMRLDDATHTIYGNTWGNGPELAENAYTKYDTVGHFLGYSHYDENTFGLLYSYNTATTDQQLCPYGWHLPSDIEWMELEMFLGIIPPEAESFDRVQRGTNEGSQLAGSESVWIQYNGRPLLEDTEFGKMGFNALPAGYRKENGDFHGIGDGTYFWTSTESPELDHYQNKQFIARLIQSSSTMIYKENLLRGVAASVRCIRD